MYIFDISLIYIWSINICILVGGLEHDLFIFPNSWDDDPNWLISFRGVWNMLKHQLVYVYVSCLSEHEFYFSIHLGMSLRDMFFSKKMGIINNNSHPNWRTPSFLHVFQRGRSTTRYDQMARGLASHLVEADWTKAGNGFHAKWSCVLKFPVFLGYKFSHTLW